MVGVEGRVGVGCAPRSGLRLGDRGRDWLGMGRSSTGWRSAELDRSRWTLASHSFQSSLRPPDWSSSSSTDRSEADSVWLARFDDIRLASDLRIMTLRWSSSSSSRSSSLIFLLLLKSLCVMMMGFFSLAFRFCLRRRYRATKKTATATTRTSPTTMTAIIHGCTGGGSVVLGVKTAGWPAPSAAAAAARGGGGAGGGGTGPGGG